MLGTLRHKTRIYTCLFDHKREFIPRSLGSKLITNVKGPFLPGGPVALKKKLKLRALPVILGES